MVGPPPSRGSFDAGVKDSGALEACWAETYSVQFQNGSNPGVENVERCSYSLPNYQPKFHVLIALNPKPVADSSAGSHLLLCR